MELQKPAANHYTGGDLISRRKVKASRTQTQWLPLSCRRSAKAWLH